jgi:hypothetical protein
MLAGVCQPPKSEVCVSATAMPERSLCCGAVDRHSRRIQIERFPAAATRWRPQSRFASANRILRFAPRLRCSVARPEGRAERVARGASASTLMSLGRKGAPAATRRWSARGAQEISPDRGLLRGAEATVQSSDRPLSPGWARASTRGFVRRRLGHQADLRLGESGAGDCLDIPRDRGAEALSLAQEISPISILGCTPATGRLRENQVASLRNAAEALSGLG